MRENTDQNNYEYGQRSPILRSNAGYTTTSIYSVEARSVAYLFWNVSMHFSALVRDLFQILLVILRELRELTSIPPEINHQKTFSFLMISGVAEVS